MHTTTYRTIKHLSLHLVLFAVSVFAHAAEDNNTYNRVTFSEQADVEVENDTLVAVMYVQKEGGHTDKLASEVNQIITRALDKLKQSPEIKVQTLTYRTNPVYHKQTIKTWRVHQAIQLESQNSKLLGRKIGELQSDLNVQSISYKVSQQKQRQYSDGLIELALQRFQQRADNIRRIFGKKRYQLVNLSINTGNSPPPRMLHDSMRMEKASSYSPAPVALQAGTQRLTVTVNGQIELID